MTAVRKQLKTDRAYPADDLDSQMGCEELPTGFFLGSMVPSLSGVVDPEGATAMAPVIGAGLVPSAANQAEPIASIVDALLHVGGDQRGDGAAEEHGLVLGERIGIEPVARDRCRTVTAVTDRRTKNDIGITTIPPECRGTLSRFMVRRPLSRFSSGHS